MHAVLETRAYLSAAKEAGMSEEEMQAVVDKVAANPQAGAVMPAAGALERFGSRSREWANRADIA